MGATAPPMPRHGLIDARDAQITFLPPGLRAVEAVGDLVLPFSDREQVVEVLSGRGGCGP